MAASVYQAVKQAIQDLVAPQLESLKGDLGAVRVDIQRVEEKLTSDIQRVEEKLTTDIRRVEEKLTTEMGRVEQKLTTEIGRVDEKLTAEIRRVDGDVHRIDEQLTWALDLRGRIIVLETKLATPGSGS